VLTLWDRLGTFHSTFDGSSCLSSSSLGLPLCCVRVDQRARAGAWLRLLATRPCLRVRYHTRSWPKIGNKHSPKTHLRQACGRGKGDSYLFEPCPGKVFNAFVIPGFVNNPLDFLLHSFTVSLSFLPRNYTTPSQSPAGLIYFLPSS